MKTLFAFDIDVIGEFTGQQYVGHFVYEHPTLAGKREIASREAKLNASFEPHPDILALNHTIAYLQVTLTEVPKWFSESRHGLDLEDEIVLDEVGKKIFEFEEGKYKELEQKVKEEKEKNAAKD